MKLKQYISWYYPNLDELNVHYHVNLILMIMSYLLHPWAWFIPHKLVRVTDISVFFLTKKRNDKIPQNSSQ